MACLAGEPPTMSSQVNAMTWLFIGGRWATLGMAAFGWAWLIGAQMHPDPTLGLITPEDLSVRPIRVLLSARAQGIQVKSEKPLEVRGPDGEVLERIPVNDWRTLISSAAATDLPAQSAVVVNDAITVAPTSQSTVEIAFLRDGQWSDALEYPGELVLSPEGDGAFAVVNHVDMERYVACVTALEVWPTFVTEALRGQAIIARTFALDQMIRRSHLAYDVSSTQGSQVYKGVQRRDIGRRAAAATRYTAGLVCAWNDGTGDRLIPTYYSAACGGMTQSAAIFGPGDDIVPLSGGVSCDFCRIAPGDSYRWGPVSLPIGTVWERLSVRFPAMHQVWPLANVEIVERAATGHVRRLRMTSASGATYEIAGENFRLALGAATIKSVHFDLRVVDKQVHFENGRGYGHALGLCQWGMQGQALAGKSAADILRYYYHDARILRAY